MGYFFEEKKIRLQPKKQPKRRNYAQSGHTAFKSVESVDNCRPYFNICKVCLLFSILHNTLDCEMFKQMRGYKRGQTYQIWVQIFILEVVELRAEQIVT